tara:strand:+ start:126 stop:398 length:273 start_codon:yes stop_codon:yes gene_type:complete
MKKLIILLLFSSISIINNCAGGGAATPTGPNTALVINPASTYIGQGATGFATVVGTGRNTGTTAVVPLWRTGVRSGIVLGGALSGAFAVW